MRGFLRGNTSLTGRHLSLHHWALPIRYISENGSQNEKNISERHLERGAFLYLSGMISVNLFQQVGCFPVVVVGYDQLEFDAGYARDVVCFQIAA